MKFKLKPKFDTRAIKAFLFRHVEKLALAVVALVTLMLIAGAMRRPTYEKTPQELAEIAKQAQQRIEQTQPPPAGFEPTYEPKAEKLPNSIKPDSYQLTGILIPPLFERPPKRQEPLLYAVEELRATPGRGAIHARYDPADPSSQPGTANSTSNVLAGQRWIVLTGRIPYKKQLKAYADAFQTAQGYDAVRDFPTYVYYKVERAEVTAAGEPGEIQWKPLILNACITATCGFYHGLGTTDPRLAEKALWQGMGNEIVSPRYLTQPPVTVFPLPPLASRTFGKEVAHYPEIILQADEKPEDRLSTGNLLGPNDVGEPGDPSAIPDAPLDAPLGAGPAMVQPTQREPSQDDLAEYRLFRFFDFEVEPGKQYQYRVQLMLSNPNFDIPSRFLAEDKLGEARHLLTNWSQPSDAVTMSPDGGVLLASVRPSPDVTREPKANVGIPYFHFERAVELFREYEGVERGRYLNFPKEEVPLEEIDPSAARIGGPRGAAAGPVGIRNQRPETVEIDFNTDMVLLDIAGGETLPGRDRGLTRPGRLLLLDSAGGLVVRDELDDKSTYDMHKLGINQRPGAGPVRRTMPSESEYGDWESY